MSIPSGAMTAEPRDCNLSSRHAGQMVRPVVSWQFAGPHAVRIEWYWIDSSADRKPYGHGTWTGPKDQAEAALNREGIYTDDTRAPF